MAIALRSAASAFQASGSNPITVNKPTGTTSGDLLIAVHFEDQFGAAASMTAASGFTQQGTTYTAGTTGAGSVHGKVWKRVADGSESSTFVFGQNNTSVITCLCISGQDSLAPIDVDVTWFTGTSGQAGQNSPSVTPSADNGMLICGRACTENTNLGTSYTAASGMTEAGDADTTFTVGSVDYLVLTGGAGVGTGTKTATCSRSTVNEYVSLSMVITPSGAGSPPPHPAIVVPMMAATQRASW